MYAGSWKRLLAFIIDYVITFSGLLVIILIVGGLGIAMEGYFDREAVEFAAGSIVFLALIAYSWLYSALFESSRLQATPGKIALGLIVVNGRNGKISFGQATARHFCKAISAALIFIGFIMAAFHPRKQGLHDMISGTLILNKSEAGRFTQSWS